MLEGIFFNEAAMRIHHKIIENCVKQCPLILAHPDLIEMNDVKGKNFNVGELLVALSKNLSFFLNRTGNQLELGANLSGQKDAFYQALRIARIDSMTYCTYLAQTLNPRNTHAQSHTPEQLSPFRGYFLLLAAINAYNLALDMHQQNKQDKAIELGIAALKWLEDIELNHLSALTDDVLFALRKELVTKISTLQVVISVAQNSQVISPKDLQLMVERKNQRAARFAQPYFGEVVCAENVANCYLPDPQSLQLLYDNIQEIVASNSTQRKQILFYYNIATGHVELLDVAFDAKAQKLFLLNISSTNLASQHYFLQMLSKQLHEKKLSYDIIACQTNIQRDGISCLLYAYALSGLVARLPFSRLSDEQFQTSSPLFFDVSHARGHDLGLIDNVKWCKIHALGNKASLMSQSFTFMEATLRQVHTAKITKNLIEGFKNKYSLVISKDLDSKRTYIDYLRNHFARCLNPETAIQKITLQGIKNKFKGNAPDIENGQMARRAVIFGTPDEFDFLIDAFAKFDIKDNPLDAPDSVKGLTPLFHALQQTTPSRALKLLATDKVSIEKAREVFTTLPAEAALAQDPTLKKILNL